MKVNYFARNVLVGMGILFSLSACKSSREMPFGHDYSYQGQFKKYTTFNFLKQSLPDSSNWNDIVETNVVARMNFLGFSISEDKPDLLISYQIISDSLRLNTYVQPAVGMWVNKSRANPAGGDDLFRYNKKSIYRKDGSIMIQFIDTRANTQIWQGYSLMHYHNINYSNSSHLSKAVVSILNQYQVWADGFAVNHVLKRSMAP